MQDAFICIRLHTELRERKGFSSTSPWPQASCKYFSCLYSFREKFVWIWDPCRRRRSITSTGSYACGCSTLISFVWNRELFRSIEIKMFS